MILVVRIIIAHTRSLLYGNLTSIDALPELESTQSIGVRKLLMRAQGLFKKVHNRYQKMFMIAN